MEAKLSVLVACVSLIAVIDDVVSQACQAGCDPPECSCPRTSFPMDRKDIPQIVYFGFDDAVNVVMAALYDRLFTNDRINPNGCKMKMTLFVSHQYTDYQKVKKFYDEGMEIAVHSVTHTVIDNDEILRQEAKQQKENIMKLAGVPEHDIVGWRSPFLKTAGDGQPGVLKELGYEYDISLTYSRQSMDVPKPWPFTMENGWQYRCGIEPCPSGIRARVHNFWAVPVVSLMDHKNQYPCSFVDGCAVRAGNEQEAFEFLWKNFLSYYNTTRTPFGLNMHAAWFYTRYNLKAMMRFLDELQTLDDVYVVTVKQMLDWMRNPTLVSEIKNFKPWSCAESRARIGGHDIPTLPPNRHLPFRPSIEPSTLNSWQSEAFQRWRQSVLPKTIKSMNVKTLFTTSATTTTTPVPTTTVFTTTSTQTPTTTTMPTTKMTTTSTSTTTPTTTTTTTTTVPTTTLKTTTTSTTQLRTKPTTSTTTTTTTTTTTMTTTPSTTTTTTTSTTPVPSTTTTLTTTTTVKPPPPSEPPTLPTPSRLTAKIQQPVINRFIVENNNQHDSNDPRDHQNDELLLLKSLLQAMPVVAAPNIPTKSPQPDQPWVTAWSKSTVQDKLFSCIQNVNCYLPNCFCQGTSIPNNLQLSDTPQLVFLTIDGSANPSVLRRYKELLGDKSNPNGCRARGTIFVSERGSLSQIVKSLVGVGAEIAMQGLHEHHYDSTQHMEEEMIAQMISLRKDGVNATGWKTPELKSLGNEQYRLLQKYGLKYDTTLSENLPKGRNHKPWPYTLDFGYTGECVIPECPSKSFPGLWEIPTVSLIDYRKMFECAYVDGCMFNPPTSEETSEFLWDNFMFNYKTNRAPFGIHLRQVWFSHPAYVGNIKGIQNFIDKILTMKDVYIVSGDNIITWMQNPTAVSDVTDKVPWDCKTS